MNRMLKITESNDQRVYFTSDTHWFHKREFVWEARGHKSPEDHTNFGINRVNEIVRPNDILFHLGDITLNCNEEQFEEMLSRINCRTIYMLWGNHNNPANKIYRRGVEQWLSLIDRGYNTHPDMVTPIQVDRDIEMYPYRYKNLVFLGNYAEVVVNGKVYVLCHYPIYVFNYMKDGAMHLCGHSHYNLSLSQSDNYDSKILDVGWDGWSKPLSVSEIGFLMEKKGKLKVDHHQED